jgi:hypothetical protein
VTPTQRTFRALEADGWTVDRVDCQGRHVSRDYLGVIDAIALRGAERLAVQITGGGNGPARVRKICGATGALSALRDAGFVVEVHDWRKSKAKGWWCWKRQIVFNNGRAVAINGDSNG